MIYCHCSKYMNKQEKKETKENRLFEKFGEKYHGNHWGIIVILVISLIHIRCTTHPLFVCMFFCVSVNSFLKSSWWSIFNDEQICDQNQKSETWKLHGNSMVTLFFIYINNNNHLSLSVSSYHLLYLHSMMMMYHHIQLTWWWFPFILECTLNNQSILSSQYCQSINWSSTRIKVNIICPWIELWVWK